jgi:hypothetical protein
MKVNKLLSSNQCLKILTALGLQINDKTGGCMHRSCGPENILKSKCNTYKIFWENGDYIFFIDPKQFFNTVQATEQSLKIKLFA